VLLALFVALQGRAARAESRLFVSLDYATDAALAGCPGEDGFRGAIVEQLGYDPFRADSPHRVVTRAHAAVDGMRGTIEWYDAAGAARGVRELHSERSDCAAFARTLAFAVAVQIQLLGQEIEEESVRADAPPAARTSEPPKKVVAPTREKRPPPPSDPEGVAGWRFGGGLGLTGELGALPGVVLAGRLFAGIRRGPVGLELGGEASLPGRYVDASGNGFEHQRAAGTLAGCGVVGLASACLLGKVGRLRVSGVGVDVPRSPAGTTVELGARLSLNPELGRFAGAVRLEALAPLVSWGVTLNGREVFRAAPVVVGLGADVGAFF
jgi:hypothetical protein